MNIIHSTFVIIDKAWKVLHWTDKGFYLAEYIDNELHLTSFSESEGNSLIHQTHQETSNIQMRRG